MTTTPIIYFDRSFKMRPRKICSCLQQEVTKMTNIFDDNLTLRKGMNHENYYSPDDEISDSNACLLISSCM